MLSVHVVLSIYCSNIQLFFLLLCIEFILPNLLQAVSVYFVTSSDIKTIKKMCFYQIVWYL